jgi:hypothetical protein
MAGLAVLQIPREGTEGHKLVEEQTKKSPGFLAGAVLHLVGYTYKLDNWGIWARHNQWQDNLDSKQHNQWQDNSNAEKLQINSPRRTSSVRTHGP